MPQTQRGSKPSNGQHPKPSTKPSSHNAPSQKTASHSQAHGVGSSKANPAPHVEQRDHRVNPADPSEPPDYDYSRDRGRKIKLRQEEQCVFNHSTAENNPLLDLKQWREKLKILRALPKPQKGGQNATTKESPSKRPKNKPSARKGGRTSKNKKGTKHPGGQTGNSPAVPETETLILGEAAEVEDTDMVSFGDILDPHLDPDTRYDKYLEELDRNPEAEIADLESLYLEKGILGRKLKSQRNDGVLRHDYEHLMQDDVTIETESNDVVASDDGEVDVAEFVARAHEKKKISVRSFSTDPIMSVSGHHGALCEKPKVESRLSLNNFKLRLHLAENENNPHPNDTSQPNSPRKSVMDSARSVDKDVKLVQYVTKNSFSPRRNNTLQHLTPAEVSGDHKSLRRSALHLPASTQNNARATVRGNLAATRTSQGGGTDGRKGGGWKVQAGVGARKELDFERMIPVSVTASLKDRGVNAAFDDLWNVS